MARFDAISRLYDLLPIPNHARVLRERLEDLPGPRLDVGGGTGKFTVRLHDERHRRVVLDASRGMLARGRRAGRDLALIQGDGARMPLREDAFGAVTVTEAFHHFAPHQRAVVDEIARVLDPDGAFLVEEIDPERLLGRVVELGENLVLRFGSVFHPPADLALLVGERFERVETERTGSFTYLLEARGPRSR